jgi:hypothetical protein
MCATSMYVTRLRRCDGTGRTLDSLPARFSVVREDAAARPRSFRPGSVLCGKTQRLAHPPRPSSALCGKTHHPAHPDCRKFWRLRRRQALEVRLGSKSWSTAAQGAPRVISPPVTIELRLDAAGMLARALGAEQRELPVLVHRCTPGPWHLGGRRLALRRTAAFSTARRFRRVRHAVASAYPGRNSSSTVRNAAVASSWDSTASPPSQTRWMSR